MPIEKKGRLDEESLTEILGILGGQGIACSFLISDGFSEKIFYFSIGGIRLVSQGGRKTLPIGEVLVQQGKIGVEDQARIQEHAIAKSIPFGEALQELGLGTREDVEEALRSQLEAELCDLFLWSEAEFEFREGQPPPQFYDTRYRACAVSCDIQEFIKGVQKRRERWTSIRKRIPTDREVFAPTARGREVQGVGAEDAASKVLSLVDGDRRVRAIVEESGFTALFVYEALHGFLEDGLVIRVRAGEGDARLAREEILKRIRRIEAASGDVMGDLIARTRLAKLYEEIDDKARAAGLWREVARAYRRKNDLKQALAALRHASRCVPEDFNVREMILEILRVLGEDALVLSEGRSLAESLFKSNLLNRAKQLLGNLVNLAPGDARLRKLYAMTLLGLGERDPALRQLEELAKLLEEEGGRTGDLKEVYRRILAIDRGNRRYRQKLVRLSTSRRALWIGRGLVAAALLVLVVAGGMFAYEYVARSSFDEKGIDLENLLAENRFDEAEQKVRKAARRFRFSSVGRRAESMLDRIHRARSWYLEHGILADFRRAERAEEAGDYDTAVSFYERVGRMDPDDSAFVARARKRRETMVQGEGAARRLVHRGEALVDKGNYAEALRILLEARSLYPTARAVRGIRFPSSIVTVPAAARVYLNGERMGRQEGSPSDATVLLYSLSEKNRLRVEMEGFEPLALDIEKPLPARKVVYLQRKTRWVFSGEAPFDASPVVHGDSVFLPGRDRYLYAISLQDGSSRFRVPLGIFGDTAASVAVAGGMVVVGTRRGDLLGVDRESGRIEWTLELGFDIEADLLSGDDGRTIYVTQSGGSVMAVDASTGEVRWDRPVAAAPLSSPVTDGRHVFIGSAMDRRLAALDAATGKVDRWFTASYPVTSSPALAGDRILFSCRDRSLHIVDVGLRKETDRISVNGAVGARAHVSGRSAYFGTSSGLFYRYDLDHPGRARWQVRLGDGIGGEATEANGRVYVGCRDGRLYCLDAADGSILWAFRTRGRIVSKPAVADGTVIVSSTDGGVYSLPE